MQKTDKTRFLSALLAMAEYHEKTLSDGVVDLWWQGLQQYDIAAVERAFRLCLSNPDTGQFMPKIADVTRMIGGTTQDSALQAWAKVDKAVRTVGTYQSVVFDDAIIHRVLHDMGGWMALGTKREDEWPFVAKEFENRYRGYKLRGDFEYPPKLLGIAEAQNSLAGMKVQPPMLIGDESKAMLVLKAGTATPLLSMKPLSESLPDVPERLRLKAETA